MGAALGLAIWPHDTASPPRGCPDLGEPAPWRSRSVRASWQAVARLLRFSRVRERLARAPGRWADIAYESGYCDQAHLNRDFRQLAGTTPTDFLASLSTDQVITDEITIVQDKGPVAV